MTQFQIAEWNRRFIREEVKTGEICIDATAGTGRDTVFLAEHPEFSMDPFALPDPVGATAGDATLWPQRHRTDGFYICRMRRQA